jgi:hypothetical protein
MSQAIIITVTDPATERSVTWRSSNKKSAITQAKIEADKGAIASVTVDGHVIWPTKSDTHKTRPVIKPSETLISLEYHLGSGLKKPKTIWAARSQYIKGTGFLIDIFRNNIRVAIRDGATPTTSTGENSNVTLLQKTLDAVIKGHHVYKLIIIDETLKASEPKP